MVKVVCAADLHLGRRLVDLPEGAAEHKRAPVVAWQKLVRWTVENRADALLLAGDVFDREEDLYEAAAVFERGVRTLVDAGIPVIAVAGNHDTRALNACRLRMGMDRLILLGAQGVWESRLLSVRGRRLRVDGWSFPASHHAGNPLDLYTLPPPDPSVDWVIGVLHCECPKGSESLYAPVPLEAFRALPPRAWVLGHVHVPKTLSNDPLVFYCGSLQGLDPTEEGVRGACLLEGEEQLRLSRIPLAPVLWMRQEVEVDASWEEGVYERLRRACAQNCPEGVEALLIRLVLTGRTEHFHRIPAWAEQVTGQQLFNTESGVPCFIEEVRHACLPDVDIASLAQGKDIVAALARCLMHVESQEMVRKAQEDLRRRGIEAADAEVAALLRESGMRLLDLMLRQQEERCDFSACT
jgi:DNA repair exonuclease SbcCD nuclease subunit